MTVPVHLATRKRNIRLTGRDRANVPMHAHTNGAIHVHAPAPHQIHSATATAHTPGPSMLTPTTTHARTNPEQALATHDGSCRMIFPSHLMTRGRGARGSRDAPTWPV